MRYLAAEVPRWSAENHCFSCHNNGDAARALYAAVGLGLKLDPRATADTDRWLSRPEGWDHNGGDGPFSDKRLARVQFASALAAAVASGRVGDRGALDRAARTLAADQADDGSWPVDDGGRVGSPATYGRPLATATALRTLRGADRTRYDRPIERAEAWLRRLEPKNIPDASARLLALDEPIGEDLALLDRGQAPEGGWGPFTTSAPEAFDTALALLALARHREAPGVAARIGRGRSYLIATQADDGSWFETTRPAGGESYAQRLSTTGWATLALLSARDPDATPPP